MRTRKIIDFSIAAAVRAAAGQFSAAGWDLNKHTHPDGPPGGPSIYLCNLEAQQLHLVHLIRQGVPKSLEFGRSLGLGFQDACNILGTLLDELGARERTFDAETRDALTITAALYIGGTQTYGLAQQKYSEEAMHFLVIRQYDVGAKEKLLRPAVCAGTPGPLSPAEVVELVNSIVELDRKAHPSRFRKAQILKFKPRSS